MSADTITSSINEPSYSLNVIHLESTSCEEYELVQSLFQRIIRDVRHQRETFHHSNPLHIIEETSPKSQKSKTKFVLSHQSTAYMMQLLSVTSQLIIYNLRIIIMLTIIIITIKIIMTYPIIWEFYLLVKMGHSKRTSFSFWIKYYIIKTFNYLKELTINKICKCFYCIALSWSINIQTKFKLNPFLFRVYFKESN